MISKIHSPSDFRQVVNSKVDQWKALDGSENDDDPREDFVEIKSHGNLLQASITSKKLTELSRDESSKTTIVEFDRPRFCHAGGAKEVVKSASGNISGTELRYDNNGAIWPGAGFSLMQSVDLDPSDAKNTFLIADARMARRVFTGGNTG